MSGGLEEAVARKLTGSSEDAAAILEELKGTPLYEQAERLLALVGMAGKALSDLPEKQREAMAPVIAQVLAPLAGDTLQSRVTRIAEAVALLKAANQLASSDGSDKLIQEIQALREELSKLKEERKRSELEQLLQALDGLQAGLADLVARVEALATRPPPQPVQTVERGEAEARGFVERVRRLKEEVEAFRQALEVFGYRVEPAGAPQKTPEELAEELKRYGFEVRRVSLTPEDVKRMIEEREREIRDRLQRELEVDKVRIEKVGEIVRAVISEVASQFARAYAEAQKEALRLRMLERLQQQGGLVGAGGAAGGEGGGSGTG